jgi:hypothetical protein
LKQSCVPEIFVWAIRRRGGSFACDSGLLLDQMFEKIDRLPDDTCEQQNQGPDNPAVVGTRFVLHLRQDSENDNGKARYRGKHKKKAMFPH